MQQNELTAPQFNLLFGFMSVIDFGTICWFLHMDIIGKGNTISRVVAGLVSFILAVVGIKLVTNKSNKTKLLCDGNMMISLAVGSFMFVLADTVKEMWIGKVIPLVAHAFFILTIISVVLTVFVCVMPKLMNFIIVLVFCGVIIVDVLMIVTGISEFSWWSIIVDLIAGIYITEHWVNAYKRPSTDWWAFIASVRAVFIPFRLVN